MASNLHSTYIERMAGENSVDPDELLWQIFDDIDSSYDLAMRAAGISASARSEVISTVGDYLTNHYGED